MELNNEPSKYKEKKKKKNLTSSDMSIILQAAIWKLLWEKPKSQLE
jgi:hypothetical protein